MATFKCPDCGATLTDDSRFCKYCGAKIDDGVKRIEVNVHNKIENVAEIKRAEREEKEFLRREKKEKAQIIAKWVRRGIVAAIALTGLILILIGNGHHFLGFMILAGVIFYIIATWMHKVF